MISKPKTNNQEIDEVGVDENRKAIGVVKQITDNPQIDWFVKA